MSYLSGLAALAGKGGPAPMGAPPASLGMGAPPKVPGLPPPPTMTGAMPTGNPGTDLKSAVDQAVLTLRDVQGHVPALAGDVDAMIAKLKAAAQSAAPPAPALGAATPPGAPVAPGAPLMDSGVPGAAG